MRTAFSSKRQGFSLIEIIITLALIALITGLMVMNLGAVIQGLGPPPMPELMHKAVREARFQAASEKQTVRLHFDRETASFRLTGENGSPMGVIPTHYDPNDRNLAVVFEQILPTRGINGLSRQEVAPIDHVRFRSDRSSTPFRVRLQYEGNTSIHYFDPFSDLEIAQNDN